MLNERERVRLLTGVVAKALELWARAYEYALDAGVDRAEFAIEISHLREIGLTDIDLRWLAAKAYIEHVEETTLAGDPARSFRLRGLALFGARSCFFLTTAGREFVASLGLNAGSTGDDLPTGLAVVAVDTSVPCWNAERQTLSFLGHLVKQFKLPSPNQVAVLSAFEEEGWPPKIYDPLVRNNEVDPKRRLQDTIKALNRSQRTRLIQFQGDGSGEGVLWEAIEEGLQGLRPLDRVERIQAAQTVRPSTSSHG